MGRSGCREKSVKGVYASQLMCRWHWLAVHCQMACGLCITVICRHVSTQIIFLPVLHSITNKTLCARGVIQNRHLVMLDEDGESFVSAVMR